jgi:hypothetical protein
LPSSVEDIYQLYGQRWAVETDLWQLKAMLCLEQLTCTTPDMVAKEIQMGITAYNLVRALIAAASKLSGIPPRGYSFTKVRRTRKRPSYPRGVWKSKSTFPHRKK